MHRHTTHWSTADTLHVGTVESCDRCLASEVADAVGAEVSTDRGWPVQQGA